MLWEMFLTTSAHAAEPAAVLTEERTETTPAEPPGTGPEGQVPADLTPEPDPPRPAEPEPPQPIVTKEAAEEPARRPLGKRPPPDPDTPAAAPRLGAGGELRLHGGLHAPVVGFALAFDWAFKRASVGFGVDYAAWITSTTLRITPGTLNLFALAIHRIPLGRISLRQRVGIGPAIAVAAIEPHKPGTTGLFFEAAPLGLEIHTRIRRLAVTLDAFSFAVSAPVLGDQLVAVVQYRVALGLRF
jgi:hypothetical protein